MMISKALRVNRRAQKNVEKTATSNEVSFLLTK